MKRKIIVLMIVMAFVGTVNAATQQEIQQAIDDGLDWLASTQTSSGSEGYWSYTSNGTLAATGSAALAFIEEGYLPGTDYIDGDGINRGDVVGKAVNYIFNRATSVSIGPQTYVLPEDYNDDGVSDGNGKAMYFYPGNHSRDVYTTGIVAPVIYALGEQTNPNSLVSTTYAGTNAVKDLTYKQAMQEVVDYFSWGQNDDPTAAQGRGGWRYYANYPDSDNSTAQWGALPMLYAQSWGLGVPPDVQTELNTWATYIQYTANPASSIYGSSGYSTPTNYNNVSKTGGLLLEFAAIDPTTYDLSNWRVDAALDFIDSRWMDGPSGTWYGNLNHPYAMWATYKALATYGGLVWNDNGTPGDLTDDFLVGNPSMISSAPGSLTIGQDWGTQLSLAGDWYSHYCDYLVSIQNAVNGSWAGYSNWTGALATGWYINILNATGVPEPIIPVPGAFLLGSIGLAFAARKLQRRKEL